VVEGGGWWSEGVGNISSDPIQHRNVTHFDFGAARCQRLCTLKPPLEAPILFSDLIVVVVAKAVVVVVVVVVSVVVVVEI
jgi:hypothetical protein